jgi:RNA polymerase sigma factor (sigma-70 family)
MVLALCRRVLGNVHDAEDAFQATFLVLVRKGGSLGRPELVGSWLHGVAYRTAIKARAMAMRNEPTFGLVECPAPEEEEEPAWRSLVPFLDEEVNRLPWKYQRPIVLCYFQGKTYAEAARALGWAEGTLSSRLARARERLRKRLASRGMVISSTALASALPSAARSASVPFALSEKTISAGIAFATTGAASGLVSAQVFTLTRGVLKAMLWTKIKLATGALLVLGATGTGTGILWHQASAGGPDGSGSQAQAVNSETQQKKREPVPIKANAGNEIRAIADKGVQTPTSLRRLLQTGISKQFEAVPFKEAYQHLAETYGVTILVDAAAFEEEMGMKDVSSQTIRLDKVDNVKLGTVLQLLIDQFRGTYLERDGVIVVVPKTYVQSGRALRYPVDAAFDNVPLAQALQTLADTSGISVVLDKSESEQAKKAVTAHLSHVPLEAAVRILADMTGLTPVILENVIYVTDKDNAIKMQAEEEKRKKEAGPLPVANGA